MSGKKPRVHFVPLAAGDEAAFLAAAKRSTKMHGPWVRAPSSRGAFQARLKRMQGPANYAYAVRHAENGELVGCIEITDIVRGLFRSGYLGYYVFAGFERRGYMREGLLLAVRHAFGKLRLHRLEANIQPANAASVALVRACGFTREGYSHKYLKIRGRWRDHERWALVAN